MQDEVARWLSLLGSMPTGSTNVGDRIMALRDQFSARLRAEGVRPLEIDRVAGLVSVEVRRRRLERSRR